MRYRYSSLLNRDEAQCPILDSAPGTPISQSFWCNNEPNDGGGLFDETVGKVFNGQHGQCLMDSKDQMHYVCQRGIAVLDCCKSGS